jgi:hypothetical protein
MQQPSCKSKSFGQTGFLFSRIINVMIKKNLKFKISKFQNVKKIQNIHKILKISKNFKILKLREKNLMFKISKYSKNFFM